MLNKMSINWSCKQVASMTKNKKCSYDNIIQRSYVWEKARQSNLIHSLIENFPVPPFYTRRINGIYDFLDGKQRIDAIVGFINDCYKLTSLPSVSYESAETGEEVYIDITGMRFSELPKELKSAIFNYTLAIYYYEDITDFQVATMFRKLNNGKPLSTKERNIANCSDIQKAMEIGNHGFFKTIITSRGLIARKQIPLVMKIWCMLNQNGVSFEGRKFNKVIAEIDITEEQSNEITEVLDKLLDMYYSIGKKKGEAEAKLLKKKLCTETHLISFTPFVKKAIDNGVTTGTLTDFFASFYGVETDASVSKIYNNACNSCAKAVNISRRNDELLKAWNKFFLRNMSDYYFSNFSYF